MDFAEKIAALAVRSKHASKHAMTEEATKTSVVMPFLQALGYDVFNLDEVVPEVIADVGIKKGEKIDFAIKMNGKISILIEAKPISTALGNAQYSQLFRYFATTDARLAILINGREIWFFSDIDEPNKMDKKPFFTFDLQNYTDGDVEELSRFEKAGFSFEEILSAASNLKYVKSVAGILSQQLEAPEDDFVRFFARKTHDGSITKAVLDQFRPAIAQALDEVIRKRIQERLNVTFGKEQPAADAVADKHGAEVGSGEMETTADEQLAFLIAQAIGSKLVPLERLAIRDAKSYCAVLLDDNNRKPVCRFYFNAKSVKHLGTFNAEKIETKHQIKEVPDIYKYASLIEEAIGSYLKQD